MSTSGPILFNPLTHKRYYFGDKVQITIGRAVDSLVQINSKVISRQQCMIKLSEINGWEIKDVSSFNSTRVNSNPISSEWQKLNCRDKITFLADDEQELIFYIDSSYLSSGKKRKAEEPPFDEPISNHFFKVDDSSSQSYISKLLAEKEELVKNNKLLEEKFQQVNQNLKEKQKSLEEKQISLEVTHKVLTETQKSLEEAESQKTTLALQCLDEKSTKENLLLQLQNSIDQLKDCELELYKVIQEKESIEEIQGNNEELCSSNETNKNILCIEVNALKEELKRVQEEIAIKDDRLTQQFNEKEILYTKLSDVIEQELSCSVCNEIMFQATTLQCRHTFCSKCVNVWKARKKDCPFCRSRIKAEVKPLVLDNVIDKLADFMGEDFKKKREDIRRERSNHSPKFTSPYGGSRGGSARRRRRGHRVSRSINIAEPFLYFAESFSSTTIDLTRS